MKTYLNAIESRESKKLNYINYEPLLDQKEEEEFESNGSWKFEFTIPAN